MPITAEIPVKVSAKLVLTTEHGIERDATPEDLETILGYVDKREVYRRLSRALALLATGDIDADLTSSSEFEVANTVRYLIETGIFYETSAANVVAHILPEEPEMSLPQLREALLGRSLVV